MKDKLDELVIASDSRTITGRILPWHESGSTSAGGLQFTPSSIRVPKDRTRVKLLRDHSPAGVPVGVLAELESRDDGLYATFSIASTEDGDRAIVEASEHIRDSFSVEVAELSRRGSEVLDCLLRGVALVAYPAFKSARVEEVQASEHVDSVPLVEEPSDDTNPDTASTCETLNTETQEEEAMTQPITDTQEARAPQGLITTPTPKTHLTTASEVAGLVLAVRNGTADDEAHAALADITSSGMADAIAPSWLGHLWDGVAYQRRLIPLVTNQSLRGMKAVGYRWTTKPKVGPYSGDKQEIPTNSPAIEAVEVEAQRWAGGHDIDRKFLDFNDSEFLAQYWAAMAESYAYETDKSLGEFLVSNAKTISGKQPDLIRAVATAAITIDEDIHTPATFAVINPKDLTTVLSLSQLDAPRFMGLTPVSDPSKWVTSEFVEQGSVIVGAKSAVTHYELAGSPIRAQAEHIAKGGRDHALFGYTAKLLSKPEGLRKITFGSD